MFSMGSLNEEPAAEKHIHEESSPCRPTKGSTEAANIPILGKSSCFLVLFEADATDILSDLMPSPPPRPRQPAGPGTDCGWDRLVAETTPPVTTKGTGAATRLGRSSRPAVAFSSGPTSGTAPVRRWKRAVLGTKDERGGTGTTWDTCFRCGRTRVRLLAFLSRGTGKDQPCTPKSILALATPVFATLPTRRGRGTARRAIISGPPDTGSYAGVQRARMNATR